MEDEKFVGTNEQTEEPKQADALQTESPENNPSENVQQNQTVEDGEDAQQNKTVEDGEDGENEQQNQNNEVGEDGGETDDLPKKKGIKGIVEYIKSHENLRQAVLFFLFSMVCGASQMIITAVLPLILRAASDSMSEPFKWFIFDYTEKGVGEFIGFIVGSVVGQVLTFVLNRKKTFNVSDHIPFRAIAYAIMAVLIILMQTAIGGGITGALAKAVPDASDIVATIFNLIAQVVAGIAALVVNFLGNKFFVMRKFGKKKETPAEEENKVE